MSELRTAHTAELDVRTLAAIRALLDAAFAGEFSDHDWDHSLGGVHALATEDARLVGHGAVVQRRLMHGGHALRAGYVEGVGVHPDRRRRGHFVAVMSALEQVVRAAYDLGALSASDQAAELYVARGWRGWRGPTSALTPTGIRRTEEEDGGVYVLPGALALDLSGPLACDWRDGDLW